MTTDRPQRRVLVLGGAGFIGRHVCQRLAYEGWSPIAASRSARPATGAIPQVAADLNKPESILPLLADVEAVICLASNSLPATANADLAGELRRHVADTIALAEQAAELGVERFIFASSGGTVYGDRRTPISEQAIPRPLTGYGAGKAAVDQFLQVLSHHAPLNTVSLRVANPYGPGQSGGAGQGLIGRLVTCVVEDEPFTMWGDGSVVRDFVHVHDVARAFTAALNYPGGEPVFNIGTGVGHSMSEVVALIQELSGRQMQIRQESARQVDVPVNTLAVDLAARELGWQPRIPLRQGIARLLDQSLSQHGGQPESQPGPDYDLDPASGAASALTASTRGGEAP